MRAGATTAPAPAAGNEDVGRAPASFTNGVNCQASRRSAGGHRAETPLTKDCRAMRGFRLWRRSMEARTRIARQSLVNGVSARRSEEHTSELQSLRHLVCRLLLEK